MKIETENIETLTYAQLKKLAIQYEIKHTGKSLNLLRKEVGEAMANDTEEPNAGNTQTAATSTDSEPEAEVKTTAQIKAEEKAAALKLKAEEKAAKDAKKAEELKAKDEAKKAALKLKAEEKEAKAKLKAEEKAKNSKVSRVKEAELNPVSYEIGKKATIVKNGREIEVMVVASVLDKRSGFTFWRMRQVFKYDDGTELLGAYFFQRNYNVKNVNAKVETAPVETPTEAPEAVVEAAPEAVVEPTPENTDGATV